MTPRAIVAKVRQLDRQIEGHRAAMAALGFQRALHVHELREKVGVNAAAEMIGVSRQAITKATRRSKG